MIQTYRIRCHACGRRDIDVTTTMRPDACPHCASRRIESRVLAMASDNAAPSQEPDSTYVTGSGFFKPEDSEPAPQRSTAMSQSFVSDYGGDFGGGGATGEWKEDTKDSSDTSSSSSSDTSSCGGSSSDD